MQLEEFFDYKNQLMKDLLTNETIVSLVGEDLESNNPTDLAYTRIFPYEYVPQTVQDGWSFICFDVDITQSVDKTYYFPTIYIWVFCHRSRLRLPEGGVRPDKICSEICKTINGSRFYGLGELTMYSSKRFSPMSDYQGHVMVFHAKDFSRVYDPKKPVPINRKFN